MCLLLIICGIAGCGSRGKSAGGTAGNRTPLRTRGWVDVDFSVDPDLADKQTEQGILQARVVRVLSGPIKASSVNLAGTEVLVTYQLRTLRRRAVIQDDGLDRVMVAYPAVLDTRCRHGRWNDKCLAPLHGPQALEDNPEGCAEFLKGIEGMAPTMFNPGCVITVRNVDASSFVHDKPLLLRFLPKNLKREDITIIWRPLSKSYPIQPLTVT
jgi:hypothetical protein